MPGNSIGLVELGSVAAGFEVCDAMLKTSDVELILSRSICSGKYMVMVRGDVAAVDSAVKVGSRAGHFSIIDSVGIPDVDDSVLPAPAVSNYIEAVAALAIIQALSVASLDAA